jgi:hypothetical protein
MFHQLLVDIDILMNWYEPFQALREHTTNSLLHNSTCKRWTIIIKVA